MAQQLLQASETKWGFRLELIKPGTEAILIIETDAAPLRRALKGSRLGLQHRRLLGLKSVHGIFNGNLKLLQRGLQSGDNRVEIITIDELLGVSASLRGVGEQLPGDSKVRQRARFRRNAFEDRR